MKKLLIPFMIVFLALSVSAVDWNINWSYTNNVTIGATDSLIHVTFGQDKTAIVFRNFADGYKPYAQICDSNLNCGPITKINDDFTQIGPEGITSLADGRFAFTYTNRGDLFYPYLVICDENLSCSRHRLEQTNSGTYHTHVSQNKLTNNILAIYDSQNYANVAIKEFNLSQPDETHVITGAGFGALLGGIHSDTNILGLSDGNLVFSTRESPSNAHIIGHCYYDVPSLINCTRNQLVVLNTLGPIIPQIIELSDGKIAFSSGGGLYTCSKTADDCTLLTATPAVDNVGVVISEGSLIELDSQNILLSDNANVSLCNRQSSTCDGKQTGGTNIWLDELSDGRITVSQYDGSQMRLGVGTFKTCDWYCSKYTQCVNHEHSCIEISDRNNCGLAFSGNISDYDDNPCVDDSSTYRQPEQQTDTTTVVVNPQNENKNFFDVITDYLGSRKTQTPVTGGGATGNTIVNLARAPFETPQKASISVIALFVAIVGVVYLTRGLRGRRRRR